MEKAPAHPQSPLYLEAYIYLLHAAQNPESARSEQAEILNVDTASLEATLPSLDDEENMQRALTQVLASSLRASAYDLGVDPDEQLSDDDAELLMIYSLGAWPDAQRNASDIAQANATNPLADTATVRAVWSCMLDKRHRLPSLTQLAPKLYGAGEAGE